jgi:hypothetical protein
MKSAGKSVMNGTRLALVVSSIVACAAMGALAPACGSSSDSNPGNLGGDSSVDTPGFDGPSLDINGLDVPSHFSDFPSTTIVDPSLGTTPLSFGSGTAPPPCVVEPEANSLYPNNWLRPRFAWIAGAGQNAFQITLTVANQDHPLVVQTASTSWTMPKDMWTALALHSPDVDMTIEIRGGTKSGSTITSPSSAGTQPMRIAPVSASGSIVYWTTTTKSLKGFSVGDEGVVDVLEPSQVTSRSIDCVGCHASTPDGDYVGTSTKLETPTTDTTTEYSVFVTPIAAASAGSEPSWLGAGAKPIILQPLRGTPTFSKAHWAAGDRLMITAKSDANPATSGGALTWIDLEASTATGATGILARTGDTGIPLFPTWSHDGASITYVSCGREVDARADLGPGDLWTIPFASKAGGTATKLAGASTPDFEENYPSYAPDDAYVAFTRVPAGGNMLFNDAKEVAVVASSGGTATRLAANDPPACTGKKSPGVANTFAKWAPEMAKDSAGTRYYWLVFSSKRDGSGLSKLYLTPFVVSPSGGVREYGSIYLWNQPDEDNHTPAWDVFKTPPVK